MQFIKILQLIGAFGNCPPCVSEENVPNYGCDPCDSTLLPGGISGFVLKKCTYDFIDIEDETEWETAIANKNVVIRLNGRRILGQMPEATFTEANLGSCVQPEVTSQQREVQIEDVENDTDLTFDDLYNFLMRKENRGKYDIGFITCDYRLIGENTGFYENVQVRSSFMTPQTNDEQSKWMTTFSFKETPGFFFQKQLPFLETIQTSVCWVETITVTGTGGAITVPDGGTLQMLAAILPLNATEQTVTWSVVPGTGTATISFSGLLSGTGVGTVTVLATATDAGAVVGQLVVTVV